MAYGENYIVSKLSSNGEVLPAPERHVVSTSEEMHKVIDEIVPQVANYFEYLLQKKLKSK